MKKHLKHKAYISTGRQYMLRIDDTKKMVQIKLCGAFIAVCFLPCKHLQMASQSVYICKQCVSCPELERVEAVPASRSFLTLHHCVKSPSWAK